MGKSGRILSDIVRQFICAKEKWYVRHLTLISKHIEGLQTIKRSLVQATVRQVKLTKNGRGVFLCSATNRGGAEWCCKHLHQNRVLSSQVCYLRPSIDPAEQFCNAVGTENCSFRKRLDAQVRRGGGVKCQTSCDTVAELKQVVEYNTDVE